MVFAVVRTVLPSPSFPNAVYRTHSRRQHHAGAHPERAQAFSSGTGTFREVCPAWARTAGGKAPVRNNHFVTWVTSLFHSLGHGEIVPEGDCP